MTSVLVPSSPAPRLHRDSFEVMGTVASVAVRSDREAFEAAARTVRRVLAAADERFSPYRPDSELNRMRGGEVDRRSCSGDMRSVLDGCGFLAAATDGAFRATTPGGLVETTGYVKGWAIQRAGDELIGMGVTDWLINVGGDVLAHGAQADRPWQVAIQHPRDRSRVAAVVPLPGGGAMATSGNAERGAHVWRADGDPVRRHGSCTVLGPKIDLADGLATAFWALGPGREALAERFRDYRVLFLNDHGRFVPDQRRSG